MTTHVFRLISKFTATGCKRYGFLDKAVSCLTRPGAIAYDSEDRVVIGLYGGMIAQART